MLVSKVVGWRGAIGVAVLASAVVACIAPAAQASDLVADRTKREELRVNKKGIAKVSYKRKGKQYCVLFRGAKNAGKFNRTGTPNNHSFKYDRSCGWKKKWINHKERKRFRNVCGKYRGPELPYVVASCTHPDGSHWVLQKWARTTPNYGGNPNKFKKELRLSHFTGEPAKLTVYPNWSWSGRFFHIAATLQYQDKPWYALEFKTNGYVTDGIGRNVTIDSYGSDMGSGWRRVNAILTHRPSGQMCYGFTPKTMANGEKSGSGYSPTGEYRLSVPGPGVSPDVQLYFTGYSLEAYDPTLDAQVNALIEGLIAGYNDGRRSCQKVN